jgi:hypothetical protein
MFKEQHTGWDRLLVPPWIGVAIVVALAIGLVVAAAIL